MTVRVTYVCDACGAQTPNDQLDGWEETADGDDLCPRCCDNESDDGSV